MDRPGYVTRCWLCGARLETLDNYKDSKFDRDNKRWITRWFDPDWVIAEHIRRCH